MTLKQKLAAARRLLLKNSYNHAFCNQYEGSPHASESCVGCQAERRDRAIVFDRKGER